MISRSHLPVLVLALLIGAGGTLWILSRSTQGEPPETAPAARRTAVARPPAPPLVPELAEGADEGLPDLAESISAKDREDLRRSPEGLMQAIDAALKAGDAVMIEDLIGSEAMDAATLARLADVALTPGVEASESLREVGELEVGARSRWALQTADQGHWWFDLVRRDGRWVVDAMAGTGSGEDAGPSDSLGIADAFLQAVLTQRFVEARDYVDGETVSDAKIAGLCILFEEGRYKLRERKPLRALFRRETLAGFLGTVVSRDGERSAQLTLKLGRPGPDQPWRISELNLDALLQDYAKRFADGDVWYTPLVSHPQGGDNLVLYFGFDDDQLSPRTQRQLEIVARLLEADRSKRLTISGHTDALGSIDYNQALSARRAEAVKTFLVSAGVAAEQIETVARGPDRPRQPNFTEDGSDNPDGRRVNRRSEIYLDF